MKTAAVLILFFATIFGVHGLCFFKFDDASRECAQPYGYDSKQVLKHYIQGYSSEEAPNFNLFVECVWKKWGYLNSDSSINYDAIKSKKIDLFTSFAICDDIKGINSEQAFVNAVDNCKNGAPSHVRAETIRYCITEHFRKDH